MLELQISESSNVNTLALLLLTLAGFVVLLGSKRYAVASLLLVALFIPLGQQFVIAGLNFRFFRVLLLVAAVRILFRGETRRSSTRVDRWIVSWALVTLICGIMRGPKADMFGTAYDLLGAYFVFRILITDPVDIVWQLKVLAAASLVMAACMTWEWFTTRNPFFIFGGVPEFTFVREGRLRCQGPFRHPIMAGTFAATLFPLLVGLWQCERRHRSVVLCGVFSSIWATYLAASSGALMTLIAAFGGLALWPMRNQMAMVRQATVAMILILAIVMKPPVWFVLAKMSAFVGGTGWHRAYLIDQAVVHLDEWWLIGSSRTAHWASNVATILEIDPDNIDITNHYIVQALKGGALGLGLFLCLLTCCFKVVGRVVHTPGQSVLPKRLVWAMGVSFAGHCTAFISVSYFDQVQIFWTWSVAVIATLSVAAMARRKDITPEPRHPAVLSTVPVRMY